MNVNRLSSALNAIAAEVSASRINDYLNELLRAIQVAMSSPTPEATQVVAKNYETVIEVLSNAPSNEALPTQRMIFDEIGASRFLGRGLLNRITIILAKINLTPQAVYQELSRLAQETKNFTDTVSQTTGLFQTLNIPGADLDPGTGEIGISVPREAFEPTPKNYEKLVKNLNFIVETFNELATNNAQPITLRAVSASDWQFYITVALQVLLLLPTAIERIMDLLNKYLDYKKKLKDLEGANFPEAISKGAQEHLEQYLPAGKKQLAEELMKEYAKQIAEERKKELLVRVEISLSHIMDLQAKGATIEVRAQLPAAPPVDSVAGGPNKEALQKFEETKTLVEAINTKEQAISSLKVADKPTLLPPPDVPE
jgi:hypothetical protein